MVMKMQEKRIVFLGTPSFAACVLEGLIHANYSIIAVITQPDKLIGRKKILKPTPVKEVALKYNIPVYQPISLKKDYSFLKEMEFEMLITAAYGQILPHEVLELAKINNINVHGSLLPRYRGGAPIQRAIINGEKKTGVTIMEMVDKMDAGKMYAKEEVDIDLEMNTTELFEKLQYVGRDLLLKVLPQLMNNELKGESQNEQEVTYAWNIKREEEKIDFSLSTLQVHNLIRGLSLTPGAYCLYKGKELKIYKAKIVQLVEDNALIGTLKLENKNRLLVRCKDGYLEILQVQLEGKQKMDVPSFLNGCNKEELLKEGLR